MCNKLSCEVLTCAPHWLTPAAGIILLGGACCVLWCWFHMSPLRRPEMPPRRSWRGSALGARGSGPRPSRCRSPPRGGSPHAFQSSFLGTRHCCACCGGAPPHCCGGGGPVHTLAESPASSSSPHVPPMLVVGVCPHGVLVAGCGGGCPPLRRFASQRSVPRNAPKQL